MNNASKTSEKKEICYKFESKKNTSQFHIESISIIPVIIISFLLTSFTATQLHYTKSLQIRCYFYKTLHQHIFHIPRAHLLINMYYTNSISMP